MHWKKHLNFEARTFIPRETKNGQWVQMSSQWVSSNSMNPNFKESTNKSSGISFQEFADCWNRLNWLGRIFANICGGKCLESRERKKAIVLERGKKRQVGRRNSKNCPWKNPYDHHMLIIQLCYERMVTKWCIETWLEVPGVDHRNWKKRNEPKWDLMCSVSAYILFHSCLLSHPQDHFAKKENTN